MKPLVKFILVFTGILLIASILAPILFDFLPYKFERIFNRIVMIASLLAVAIFVRINAATLAGYGLLWKKSESLKLFGLGFFAGLATLTLLAVLKIFCGVAVWSPEQVGIGAILLKMLGVFGAAVLIGVIEEFFFRGFVLDSLAKIFRGRLFWAVIVTSIFYSLIHFIGEKKPFIGPDPNFMDSLKLIVTPLKSLLELPVYWRGAVGLFLFGIALFLALKRTGSLYPSIGLHAGCVFFVKLDGLFVDFSNDHPFLWGSAKMYDGLAGWIFLTILSLAVLKFPAQQKIAVKK